MMKRIATASALIGILSLFSTSANAIAITQTYGDTGNGGIITYTDLGSNQLQIEFDNISTDYSALITGLVFDIVTDIEALTVGSFTDGNNVDLTSYYSVNLNVANNITPGNTQVDLAITTISGVNGGIYNAAHPGSDLNNAFPDIATLVLNISDPDPWGLTSIGNDWLRMQRVGADGELSLKLPGGDCTNCDVPEPGIAGLLGIGLLGMIVARRRMKV